MKRKLIISTSIAVLAIVGSIGITKTVKEINDSNLITQGVISSSERATEGFYLYNNTLTRVGSNEFSFDFQLLKGEEDVDFSTWTDDSFFDDVEVTYNVNGVQVATPYDLTSTDSYWTLDYVDNTQSSTLGSYLYGEMHIFNADLNPGDKIDTISVWKGGVNTGDRLMATSAGPLAYDADLDGYADGIVNYSGAPVDVEVVLSQDDGAEGKLDDSANWFIMPQENYIKGSLSLVDVSTDYIDVSIKFNGSHDQTKALKPVFTYEDAENENKQRIMSSSVNSYTESNEGGIDKTEYIYRINGVANQFGGVDNLKPNYEYTNARAYGSVAEENVENGYLTDAVDPNTAYEEPYTVSTLAVTPTVKGTTLNNSAQTSLDFDIEFNASSIIKTDDSELALSEWVQYGSIDEDTLAVTYDTSTSKVDTYDTPIVSTDWAINDENNTIVGSYTINGLTPETNYDIFVDIDNTDGVSKKRVATFATADYDPLEFTTVNVLTEDYKEADISVIFNGTPGALYNEEFDARNVRAYWNIPTYDGDTTVFKQDHLLDVSLEAYDEASNTYAYKIDDLNPETLKDGVLYNDVRLVYLVDGVIQKDSVSEAFDIETKPLEYVEIDTDVLTGKADVKQTGQTISTINIELPGLNSAGSITGSGTFLETDAYQAIEYGASGNLQFALTPVGAYEGKAAPSPDNILTADEVIINGPTKFVLDVSGKSASEYIEEGSDSSYSFDLQVGTLDPTDGSTWVWTSVDETVNTTPLLTPDTQNVNVVVDSIGQNDADITIDILHASVDSTSSSYATFDPETDIEFKAASAINPFGDNVTFTYVGEDASEINGEETLSTYHYTLHNLRAETEYTSIGTSITGGKYTWTPTATLTTLNRNMVGFDTSTINWVPERSTWDSITFTIDAKTGGNYKELLVQDDLGDLKIFVDIPGGRVEVDDFDVKLTRATDTLETNNKEVISTGGDYNHEEHEVTNNYEFTLNNMSNPTWYFNKIESVVFQDNSGVFGSSTIGVPKLEWYTIPRQPVQFAPGSSFEIITDESDENATDSFEFLFDLNYNGEYMNFDPAAPYGPGNEWEIRLFAKSKPIGGIVTPYYTEIEIEYVETIDKLGDSNHTLKYEATGLKPDTVYSDITLTVDREPNDFPAEWPFNSMITYDGTFTTASLRSPIKSNTFYASDEDIANTSFIFSISAVAGSEEDSIKDSGYDVFDPKNAYLGYKDSALIEHDLDTKYLGKDDVSNEQKGVAIGSDEVSYRFEVSGLEADTTYNQLYFNYNGETGHNQDLDGYSVKTKAFRSPFDPDANPIEFDYDSITDHSFQFSVFIYNIDQSSGFSNFAKNETIMFGNSTQLNTVLINEEKGYSSIDDDETGETYSLDKYTYEVNGLNDDTTYEDFTLVINAYEGKQENNGITSKSRGEGAYYRNTWTVPYVTIRTKIDNSKIIKLVTIIVIMFIILLIIFIIYWVHAWWIRHISLSIYNDQSSFEVGMPIYRLINGKKHHSFWHSFSDDMRIYASGEQIEATFIRVLDEYSEPTGDFQIVLSDIVHNPEQLLYIFNAIRYESVEISWDGGQTIHPLHILKSKKVSKAEKAAMKRQSKFEEALKYYEEHDKKTSRTVRSSNVSQMGAFLIHKKYNTSTSVRQEIILPKDHTMLPHMPVVKEKIIMYHQVDTLLYPLEVKFLEKEGAIWKFDIVGLKPGTTYTNLHWSIDGGKTITASKMLHFETRDENGNEVTLMEAKMAEPGVKSKAVKLPPIEDSYRYLGRYTANHTVVVSAQKHIQRDTGFWIKGKELDEMCKTYLEKWYDADLKLEKGFTTEQSLKIDDEETKEFIPDFWRDIEKRGGYDKLKTPKKSKKEEIHEIIKEKKRDKTTDELEAMTKAQLMELAEKEYEKSSLKGYKKADLVELLKGGAN